MPELPEVETVRRGLEKKLLGRRLSRLDIHFPKIIAGDARAFAQRISGCTFKAFGRHGKTLFVETDGPTFSVHLRMTGQLVFEKAPGHPDKHTHLTLTFDSLNEVLHYRDIRKFGRWKLEERGIPATPDAWLATPDQLLAALRNKSGMLKHALLNQNVLSGLGNIYVDECLYLAKLHPKKRLETVRPAQLSKLVGHIKTVLGKSIEIGGTSFRNYVDTAGTRGGYKDWLKVYGKDGSRCRCGATIKKIVVATRGTHFCPSCQRSPRPI